LQKNGKWIEMGMQPQWKSQFAKRKLHVKKTNTLSTYLSSFAKTEQGSGMCVT
jgi:hypothetical protein